MRNADPLRQNESAINFLSRALDAIVVVATGLMVGRFYFGDWRLDDLYWNTLILGSVLTLVVFPSYDIYRSWRGRSWLDHLRVVFLSVGSVMVALVVLSAAFRNTSYFSRVWFALWAVATVIAIFTYRRILMLVLQILRNRGWNNKRIVIFGAGSLGRRVADHLLFSSWSGYQIACFMDDYPHDAGSRYREIQIQPARGLDIDAFLRKNDIQEIWITLPLRAEERVRDLLYDLRHSTASIRFVPNIFGLKVLFGHSLPSVAGVPVLDISTSPMSGLNLIVKHLEDMILASIIIVLVSPIMLLIAIAIRLDSRGPIIFKQERHGWDGKVIRVYKFRSMAVHKEVDGQMTQATKNDARITRIGSFLRKSSLDELPQFFNVLQGRMSVVGPRPHAVVMNEYYKDKVDFYFQRHKVKPGITGLAQVSGLRGETDTIEKMERRIELDLEYIQNWSVWLDLKIVFLTIFKGFVSKNAY